MLLATPRATQPISHRIRGLETIPLYVRALVPIEEAECYSASDGIVPETVARSSVVAALISASLYTPKGRAFATPAEVGRLTEGHANALGVAVVQALDVISPSYSSDHVTEWQNKLKLGAKDPRNISLVIAMGGCVDVSNGFGVSTTTGRPDRYFGLPPDELTDGQRMAFSAARNVIEDLRKSRN